ncbi:MAG: outer membrane protein assembly factor BamB [Woeseiaceae bacterium]|nr:outer membrane protein assembly factor BamB [Woeseiaceae bacterium]
MMLSCMQTAGGEWRNARIQNPALVLLAAMSISACGIFGGDDDEELQPTELLDFEETLDVRRIWSTKLGDGTEFLRVALSPASDGNRVYAASYDGKVSALNPENGRRIWRTDVEVILSAGPGVGEGVVVVAGYDGDLVALSAEDGAELWRINVTAESLARPLIADNSVVVKTIDGRLRVYSIFDGSERWAMAQSLPSLTLRGSAAPILVGSTVIAGFDNGRLIALNLDDGSQEWEAILTPPSGRSDLDRLSDIDGSMAAVGQDVYATGYHGRVASLAVESGQALWAREISGLSGVAADWNNVYMIGEQGELIALLRRNGDDVWRQEALIRREPTAPVVFGTSVVVGDFEGYVHFFNNFDGRPVARERVGKGMISAAPVVIGSRLYVQSESGTLAAFELRVPERPAQANETETAAAGN